MADKPIIFAMANPDPEITPEDVAEVRSDAIVATGRSDYPNQINNVLGFPFIFRGALDVRASTINEAMKIAAANALAKLAREDVPDQVAAAFLGWSLSRMPMTASTCIGPRSSSRSAWPPCWFRLRSSPGPIRSCSARGVKTGSRALRASAPSLRSWRGRSRRCRLRPSTR
jgi:hypothetical protein